MTINRVGNYFKIISVLCFWCIFFSTSLCTAGETVRVQRVINGNTIELKDGRVVKYIGVQVPEVDAVTGDSEYYGKEALSANRHLVRGKTVELEFDVLEKDEKGTILAYVYVNKTFVNLWLIKFGYAKAVPESPNLRFSRLFKQFEEEARALNLGLWTGVHKFSAEKPDISLWNDEETKSSGKQRGKGKKGLPDLSGFGMGELETNLVDMFLKSVGTPIAGTASDKMYHTIECPKLREVGIEDVVPYESILTAENAGYKSCPVCNPK